jgi:hypothetical protein
MVLMFGPARSVFRYDTEMGCADRKAGCADMAAWPVHPGS